MLICWSSCRNWATQPTWWQRYSLEFFCTAFSGENADLLKQLQELSNSANIMTKVQLFGIFLYCIECWPAETAAGIEQLSQHDDKGTVYWNISVLHLLQCHCLFFSAEDSIGCAAGRTKKNCWRRIKGNPDKIKFSAGKKVMLLMGQCQKAFVFSFGSIGILIFALLKPEILRFM